MVAEYLPAMLDTAAKISSFIVRSTDG